ncbi:DUF4411 family protein [Bifidobacterium sp. W8116]|uniref:DUF4411 family protein n=1 Tax=Bifidobacterium choladohabitans TaxID=2750947 RepID=A0ABS0R112_9BIFI|nr:DUF4411 family protein [Bifidobacterium choladohabitans]MBI0143870.1 DUF4411 family protein [Bifidobacterium choladohabitans]
MTQPSFMDSPFLIDANCLIEPYNRYYSPQFALSKLFWNHLHDLVNEGQVAIIDKVRDEVYGHNCPEVDTWLDAVKSIMVACEKEDGIVEAYGTVLKQIARPENGYQPTAIRDWADKHVADPWLIATAKFYDATIVTFEQPQAESDRPWRHPKIPTVASQLTVNTVGLFAFMQDVGGF